LYYQLEKGERTKFVGERSVFNLLSEKYEVECTKYILWEV